MAVPFAKLSATEAVTSLPHCETPSETTPLSEQNITTAFLSITGTSFFWIPASLTIIFSSSKALLSAGNI